MGVCKLYYRIVQFFGRGKYWRIWQTVQESPTKTARHLLETARYPPNILIVAIHQSFAPPKIAPYGIYDILILKLNNIIAMVDTIEVYQVMVLRSH